MSAVLKLDRIERTFYQGGRELRVLKGASLTLKEGEVVGLLGASGSGKSTLLHIAGLLERPDAGQVIMNGKPSGKLTEQERTLMRRDNLGFIYQFHHLLQEFTATENVMLPLRIIGRSVTFAKPEAEKFLKAVGLGERMDHLPSQLSGGEQQRVAIARAMVNKPLVILADEPTGNLDKETADRVIGAFIKLVRANKMAALIATHNVVLAGRMDRCLLLYDGVLSRKKL
ncbi:MAG: ABC transporter ATP-binding protein [Proteobacteria bacterium]|nr:ABC transporter ATP-binding protein [Pseudomonadota bacterium]MCH8321949.1 ABC transporter ATP-binding protein [Pseudomonadota bacterium]